MLTLEQKEEYLLNKIARSENNGNTEGALQWRKQLFDCRNEIHCRDGNHRKQEYNTDGSVCVYCGAFIDE